MRYLSVCSGIEAATVAWHPLGWTPAAFAEIDKFPRAVLQHHYPTVPLHGDFTTIKGDEYGSIDLLVGGTPCQDFSVAGLREGIVGDRGNLTLEFLRLAQRTRPRWLVWENVPGVLSSVSHAAPDPVPPPDPVDVELDGQEVGTEDEYDSEELHALNSFLAGLSELGYGYAYRCFDAQYFGLAQRRARVFVVGYLGDWRRAAAVLLEPESLHGNPPPSRQAGERVARPVASSSPGGSGYRNDADTADSLVTVATLDASFARLQGASGQDLNHGRSHLVAFGGNNTSGPIDVATAVNAHGGPPGRLDFESETFIAFSMKDHGADAGPLSPTLRAGGFDKSHANGGVMPAIAFSSRFKGDDGRGYERPPQSYVEHVGAIDTVTRHSVAFTQNSRSEVRKIGGDGDIVGALAGDHGVQQQNYVAIPLQETGKRTGRSSLDLKSGDGIGTDGAPMFTLGADTRHGVFTSVVRRLTPRECERLQGFPDDYTLIEYRGRPAADGPRYKALGNSMATPVMRWLGGQIDMVEALSAEAAT